MKQPRNIIQYRNQDYHYSDCRFITDDGYCKCPVGLKPDTKPTLSRCCGAEEESYSADMGEGTYYYICSKCKREFIPTTEEKYEYFNDGNMICCVVKEGFTNIQECDAGFGKTKEEALVDLLKSTTKGECQCYLGNVKRSCDPECNCKCHPPESSAWMEDFDEKFVIELADGTKAVGFSDEDSGVDLWQDYKIKSFIAETIQKAVEAERERCLAAHSSQIPFIFQKGQKIGVEQGRTAQLQNVVEELEGKKRPKHCFDWDCGRCISNDEYNQAISDTQALLRKIMENKI